MLLSEIQTDKKVLIKEINADVILKKRLRALGIRKNIIATVLEESLGKQNIKISIGSAEVALRASEAKQIEVEEIK